MCKPGLGRLAILGVSLLFLLLAQGNVRAADDAEEVKLRNKEAHIQKLIGELGSPMFHLRERAQAQLLELGLDAFEAVFEAQTHRDVEIATRARYIVRGMNVRWFADEDPPEIKRILRDYGDLRSEDRQTRVERLSQLDLKQITPALCRIARYEPDAIVSKFAALKLMDKPSPDDAAARREIATTMRGSLETGRRTAALWLRQYASTLDDPAGSLPAWERLVDEELKLLNDYPLRTRGTLCRDLLRWHIKLLIQQKQEPLAEQQTTRLVQLIDGSREQVTELVTWLITRESWKNVIALYERHTVVFDEFPFLLYQYALAQLKLGNQAAADATADRALHSRPNNPEEHYAAAYNLKETGLFKWAEKEFLKLIKEAAVGNRVDIMARLVLSEMFHDLQRELEAAETLKGLCDAMDKDPQVKESVDRVRDDVEGVYSRMNYFFAEHFREQKDFKKQTEYLDLAVKFDPQDADVLIALYRLPNQDKAREARTKVLIEEATNAFRTEIDNFRKQLESLRNESEEVVVERELAISCNQFAWLVGNTIGDYDEAIRASHRSLEIRKNEPGYLDTLGRCYYTRGDLDNALKYQREAVRLDPHAQAIRRQLELFEKEAAAKKVAPQAGPPK